MDALIRGLFVLCYHLLDGRHKKMMFTAGRDGSVCLRVAGALEDIAAQIGLGGAPIDGGEDVVPPSAVTFLSHPVGALRGIGGRWFSNTKWCGECSLCSSAFV